VLQPTHPQARLQQLQAQAGSRRLFSFFTGNGQDQEQQQNNPWCQLKFIHDIRIAESEGVINPNINGNMRRCRRTSISNRAGFGSILNNRATKIVSPAIWDAAINIKGRIFRTKADFDSPKHAGCGDGAFPFKL
jgi:hypothetical protein